MIELDENVIRLISAKASKIKTYTGRQLKEAILKSEGRVLMGQTYLKNPILFPNCTSTELMFAFGGDMVMLNGLILGILVLVQDYKVLIIKVLKTWWEEDLWVFTWDVLRKDWILQATIYMICPA